MSHALHGGPQNTNFTSCQVNKHIHLQPVGRETGHLTRAPEINSSHVNMGVCLVHNLSTSWPTCSWATTCFGPLHTMLSRCPLNWDKLTGCQANKLTTLQPGGKILGNCGVYFVHMTPDELKADKLTKATRGR